MPDSDPPLVLRWRVRRRRRRAALAVLIALSVGLWVTWGLSYTKDCGVFYASPSRPSNAGGAQRLMRDETHLMLGRGRLILLRIVTHSDSFVASGSKRLAWAVVSNSPHATFSLSGGPGRPFFDVPLWALAAGLTLVSGVLIRQWGTGRVLPGSCVACGYDLRAGSDRPDLAGRCPECGMAQPCLVCGRSLLGVPADAPCPGCGGENPMRAR